MVQLIATPEKYHGKLIRVIGFLSLEFEGNALYLHREDYVHCLMGNAIWVNVTPEMDDPEAGLDMHYVLLEGVFNSNHHGHMNQFAGALTRIRRAQRWLSREGRVRPPSQ